ncbi:MAG: type II toxin-antitoxin system VapC family toxin [Candidatus Jacksonbacteria bacterium]
MNYLLDTDQIIHYLKGESHVVERLNKLLALANSFFISVITIAEYYQGAHASLNKQRELKLFNEFLKIAEIEVISIDENIAKEYGRMQGVLQRQGLKGSGFDMLIAAVCLVHNFTLITGNKKDFRRVKELLLFED